MPHPEIVSILLAGLIINAADIGVTLLFAAKAWNKVLEGQSIEPSPFTPPFYIIANFIGGGILVYAWLLIASNMTDASAAALVASVTLWFVTRLYGAGHVVMRQMPWHLFAIMSGGLGAGYILAGQFLAYRLG